jgi:hypothetical protein
MQRGPGSGLPLETPLVLDSPAVGMAASPFGRHQRRKDMVLLHPGAGKGIEG